MIKEINKCIDNMYNTSIHDQNNMNIEYKPHCEDKGLNDRAWVYCLLIMVIQLLTYYVLNVYVVTLVMIIWGLVMYFTILKPELDDKMSDYVEFKDKKIK